MAGSARDIQMRELKDTISELNKLIKTCRVFCQFPFYNYVV